MSIPAGACLDSASIGNGGRESCRSWKPGTPLRGRLNGNGILAAQLAARAGSRLLRNLDTALLWPSARGRTAWLIPHASSPLRMQRWR
jgi:hypothetical protein